MQANLNINDRDLFEGIQYHRTNNLNSAERFYKSFLKRNPNHPLALSLLGTIHIQNKLPKEAISLFMKSIKIDAYQPFSYCNLGIAEFELKRFESSFNNLSKALLLKPDYFEAFNALGNTCIKLGFIEKAFESFSYALQINPNFTDAYINRANLYYSLEKFNESLEDFKKAISIDISDLYTIQKYGDLLIKLKLYDQAIHDLEGFLRVHQNNQYILLNLAICYQKRKNYFKASEIYDTILQINCSNLEALNNKALIYQNQNSLDQALNLYKKIINIDKSFTPALLNIGIILLIKENFLEGWNFYEYRKKSKEKVLYQKSFKPELLDFNTPNKIIFICAEQGLGDQIIYSSLLIDAFKTKNHFYVSLDSRLIPIFKRSFCQFNCVTFISADEKLAESKYDFHLPMGSLGKFFRNSVHDFVSQPLAYLKADKTQVDSLKMKVKKESHKICGISWRSANEEIGEEKSLSLIQLLPILSKSNITFIDLQYGDTSEEKKYILNEYGIEIKSINEIDNFNDLDGLTSLVEACDFIVTTSNFTAHLAGALNKKTYLLLPFASGRMWYWGDSREVSLWYPSISIFRNTKHQSWDKTIDALSKKIGTNYA